MNITILYPLILTVHISCDLDYRTVTESLNESFQKFEEIAKPIPILYRNTYRQDSILQKLEDNSNLNGIYVFVLSNKKLDSSISVKDDKNVKSTLIHEFTHAILVQILGEAIHFVPWFIREGIAELASMTSKELTNCCKNTNTFTFDQVNEGGYTEATALMYYYKYTNLSHLLGMYFFCVKNSNREVNKCNKKLNVCMRIQYNNCNSIFERCKRNYLTSYVCNSFYKTCLDSITSSYDVCNYYSNQCLKNIERKCLKILKHIFIEQKFKRFIEICTTS